MKKEYLFVALVVLVTLAAFVFLNKNKNSAGTNPPPADKASGENTVAYTNSGFAPDNLAVTVGTTVTFIDRSDNTMWVGSNPHPVHTDYSAFDQLKTGGNYTFTFTKTGTYNYHNHLFPAHTGVVTVE